jgi:hypothetical protein
MSHEPVYNSDGKYVFKIEKPEKEKTYYIPTEKKFFTAPEYKNEIKLDKRQIKSEREQEYIHETVPICIQLSPPGSGKTYISLNYSKRMNFDYTVVICGKKGVHVWVDTFFHHTPEDQRYDENGLCRLIVVNFEKISRGSNSLINKIDDKKYEISEEFEKILLSKSIHLVIDECHNTKNPKSNLFNACNLIIGTVVALASKGSKSRISLLSASPIDKLHEPKIYIGFFGYSTSFSRDAFPDSELYEFCKSVDEEETDRIILRNKGKEGTGELIMDIYISIFKKYFSTNMKNTRYGKYENKYFNMIHKYESESIETYLREVKKINEEGGVQGALILSRITEFLKKIELEKMYPLSQEIIKRLEDNKQCKIPVYLNFMDSFDKLATLLKAYDPLLVRGKVSFTERKQKFEKFNEPNLDNRVLICISKCVSESISLHDKDGRFPRICYYSPSYHTTQFVQIIGRTYRKGLKSDVMFIMYFVKHKENEELCEKNLLEKIMRKKEIITECSGNTFYEFGGEIYC